MLSPTPDEQAQRDRVLDAVLNAIKSNHTIKLPEFDPTRSRPGQTAFATVGIEDNPFGGTVGTYRYQLEGEEDLLHLIVTRKDGDVLTTVQAQEVAGFLFPEVPAGILWLKPGTVTQHFYLGHDELL